jgi:hypothetical protein
MKRPWLVLIAGLLLALLAYGVSYLVGSAPYRGLQRSPAPELAWLQQEFHLSTAEFDRISKLHEAYLAGCAERCRRIDAKNAELEQLLAATNTVTPAIEQQLQEAARLRAECQKAMLQHFYEVSRTMPPEQGRRYLAWVTARTLGSTHATMTQGPDAAADHEHHHE